MDDAGDNLLGPMFKPVRHETFELHVTTHNPAIATQRPTFASFGCSF